MLWAEGEPCLERFAALERGSKTKMMQTKVNERRQADRKHPAQHNKKAPAPSTLMALERTYLTGVIASYPIVLFFGPFAHFHGNLIL